MIIDILLRKWKVIKRNGVEVMNARTKNVAIAKETIAAINNQKYTSLSGSVVDISVEMDYAIDHTVYYEGDSPIEYPSGQAPIHPIIEVINETTTQAAVRLQAAGKTNLVALNFASARNQGGGFLSGALAQEEDLCRASGLYGCLKRKPLFYNANILCDDSYYTNGILYSPNVPFFRDEHNLFLEKPFPLSIISAPAPNLNGAQNLDKALVAKVLANRMDRILQTAYANGHENIILGAWGCGAFGNDPADVAKLFKSALITIPAFKHVTFAVYDTREPPVIYETFKEIFK
jgi:uncharacterized protein (TIGR02452 family)